LKGERSINVPELKDFRSYIGNLKCPAKEQVFIKTLYLTGAKASELLTKTTPYQLKHNKSKSYGSYLQLEMLRKYQTANGQEIPLLLLKLAVAKQTKKKMVLRFFQDGYGIHQEGKQSQNDQSELVEAFSAKTQKVRMRVVPIPCSLDFEPWCYDLLRWIQNKKESNGTLSFGFTEMTAQNIVKRNLSKLNATISPRLLRNYRITHLMENYGFSYYQIAAFTGWSLSSMFKSMRIEVSSNKDNYYEQQWRDFVGKLLVPLDKVF